MKTRYIWLIVAAVLILAVGIGSTVAYLVASSRTLENTFTVGHVEIELSETTGTVYKLAPGVTLMKDPTVTVKAGSDACWLFVKVQKTAGFDSFCTFEMQSDWTSLPGVAGVYYQKVEKTAVDRMFKILKNDRVMVRDTVTEEQLSTVGVNPTLDFTAYAVQSAGLATPQEAWQEANQ